MKHLRNANSETGSSLVELLTVIVLAGVVGGMAVVALANLLGFQRQVEARGTAQQQAQLAVDQLASQIRSGNVLYQPETISGGYLLRAYTQANGVQKCVEWEYRNAQSDLRYRSWDPDWRNVTGGVSNWRTVAEGLANHTVGVAPFAVPPDAPYGARLLTVDLRVQTSGGETIAVTSAATGRNTEYGYDNLVCNDRPAG